ncbi:MAG TPA: hypothetical protein VEQ59_18555 [Polyangiaceae bacterium]|nr:hypothetical protein [Polyangiaceae bacterium]
MTLGDLLILYGAAGLASASVAYRASPERGQRAVSSAALGALLWPLWLPVALSARRRAVRPPLRGDATRAAIWEAHEAVVGSPLEPLLPRDAALRILGDIERAADRYQELVGLLGQPRFSLAAAEARLEQLVGEGTSARGLAPARLHLENVRRLEHLRGRDEQTLLELSELATALRTQLVLARYSGSAPTDAGDIVSEVWARVEVLGSTLQPPLNSELDTSHAPDQAHPAG